MAILGHMDKVVAASALFSVTILEGGGMVLAKIFRDEGREEGLEEGLKQGRAEGREQGRAEAQERIDELQKYIEELEASRDKSSG